MKGYRKIHRGIELFGKVRLFWNRKNWRSKPHPYWFYRNYHDVVTFQCMAFEIFYYKY